MEIAWKPLEAVYDSVLVVSLTELPLQTNLVFEIPVTVNDFKKEQIIASYGYILRKGETSLYFL